MLPFRRRGADRMKCNPLPPPHWLPACHDKNPWAPTVTKELRRHALESHERGLWELKGASWGSLLRPAHPTHEGVAVQRGHFTCLQTPSKLLAGLGLQLCLLTLSVVPFLLLSQSSAVTSFSSPTEERYSFVCLFVCFKSHDPTLFIYFLTSLFEYNCFTMLC